MGRSNKAARQRNARGRLNRRQKGEPRFDPPQQRSIGRIPVEEMVLPDGQCMRNPARPKVFFATESKARAALEQARLQRRRMGSGHVEKRYYECPKDAPRSCGGYHLTSRDEYDNTWKRTP